MPTLERLSTTYLAAVLGADTDEALAVASAARAAGFARTTILERIVANALHHVGALWERNELTVADEVAASEVTRTVLSTLAPMGTASDRQPAVVACVAPETHVLGAHAVAAVLEEAGWDPILLSGAQTPVVVTDVTRMLRAPLVAVSVKMPDHVHAAIATARLVRSLDHAPSVVVGGAAVRAAKLLAGEVDLATDDLVEAGTFARRLAG